MSNENKNSSSVKANTDASEILDKIASENETEESKVTIADDPKLKEELLKALTAPVIARVIKRKPKKETPKPIEPEKIKTPEIKLEIDPIDERLKKLENEAREGIKNLPSLLNQEVKLQEQLFMAQKSSSNLLKAGQELIAEIKEKLTNCQTVIAKFDDNTIEYYKTMRKIELFKSNAEKEDLESVKKMISNIIDGIFKMKMKRIQMLEKDENIPNKLYWEGKIYAPVTQSNGNKIMFQKIAELMQIFKNRVRTEKEKLVKEITSHKEIGTEQLRKLNLEGITGTFSFCLYDKERKSRNWMLVEITNGKEIVLRNITIHSLTYLVGTRITTYQAERGWIRNTDCPNDNDRNDKKFLLKLLGIAAPPKPRQNSDNQINFRKPINGFRRNTD